MIHVRVDMWPGGDETKKYSLFDMTLTNSGGNADKGNYLVKIFRRPKRGKWMEVLKVPPLRVGLVEDHPRKLIHVAHLIAKAIRSCYPE